MSSAIKGNNVPPDTIFVSVEKNLTRYQVGFSHSVRSTSTGGPENLGGLVECSREEMLSLINSRLRRPRLAYLIVVGAAIVACLILLLPLFGMSILDNGNSLTYPLPLAVAVTTFIVGGAIAVVVDARSRQRKTTALRYELNGEVEARFIALQESLAALANSSCIWQITARSPNWDWKRQAGASSIIKRTRATVSHLPLIPFVRSNIRTHCLETRTTKLFFLPDQLLLYRDRWYIGIGYDQISIDVFPARFIEDDRVPRDSRVVGHTWQYVRKDGGPDLRFTNNRRIPVVEYGQIEILYPPVLSLELHISSLMHTRQFAHAFQTYASIFQNPRAVSSGTNHRAVPGNRDPQQLKKRP